MDRDSNFNPVYPFSTPSMPLEADCAVPPEMLVAGFSFTPLMTSWVAPQPGRKPPWGGERRYSLFYEKPHLAAAGRRYSLSAEVHKKVDHTGSGSSTVAIDNKIEQAMDLVKSHLMYAVREEVEVLKEQIKELMERLHKLEQENKVLRSEATPETLSKLPAPLPPIQNPLLQQLMTSLHNPPSSSTSS